MKSTMNRRNWIKANTFAAAGLALSSELPASSRRPTHALSNEIRLHSNENPLGPSAGARRAMLEAFDAGCRYPSDQYRRLQTLIAEKEDVSPDHVVLGAGSHEIIRAAATAYSLNGGEIMTAYPTYEGMERYARQIGAFVHRVPIDSDMLIDLEEMERRATQAVKLVFVCNPNNPTGTVLPGEQLQAFCEEVSRRTIVYIDEAYHEYVADPAYYSMSRLVRQGHNVIVSRTFSKIYGLAGLRIGYGLMRPDIANRLRGFLTGSGVNILAVQAALASLGDADFVAASRKENAEGRTMVTRALTNMGYRVLPSEANFVFFHLRQNIETFGEAMRRQAILVGRPFPPFYDWCRLSIGTTTEMQTFIDTFRTQWPHSE